MGFQSRPTPTSDSRRGQVAQASDSPSDPVTSEPPQEPLRHRPSSMTPTAMIAMTIAMPPRVSRNSAISFLFYCPGPHAGRFQRKKRALCLEQPASLAGRNRRGSVEECLECGGRPFADGTCIVPDQKQRRPTPFDRQRLPVVRPEHLEGGRQAIRHDTQLGDNAD